MLFFASVIKGLATPAVEDIIMPEVQKRKKTDK